MNNNLTGNILGASRAESDKKMLETAFVGTADYRALTTTKDFNFVVGRRGAGKSALFIKISEYFKNNGDNKCFIYDIKNKEYDALEYQSILNICANDYNAVRAITRVIWRANFLLAVLFDITNYYKFNKLEDSKYLLDIKSKFLKYQSYDILKRCAELLKKYITKNKSCRELPGLIANDFDIENFNSSIREALERLSHSAIFMFDGLDEGWFPNQTSTAILGGLATAATDLSDNNTPIHSILFIRDNIFRALAVFDKDFSRNIEGYTLRLRWDEASLFNFIACRLRVALNLNIENDVKVWNRFAQRELKDRNGFKKCLQYTLFRPRDLLVLLNSAFLIASREGHNEIIDDDIDAASKQISKDRLSDLIKEYEVVFPGIKLIIDTFRNRPAFDNYLSLEKFIDDKIENNAYDDKGASDFAILGSGKEVFFALYSIGFIGLCESSSEKLIFCHDGSPISPGQLDKDQMTCIHPCYWKALDITERKIEETVLNDIYDEYEIKNNPEIQDQRTRRIGQLISILPSMKVGKEESAKFEDWVFQTVRILFSGNLSNPEMKANKNAVQRRDIIATNQGNTSFWSRIINDYNSRQIIFECKNYEEITFEDYRQALSYTSGVYGKFIILVTRTQSEGLSHTERGWVKEMYDQHKVLIFTIPANIMLRCVRKIRNAKRYDYTDDTLSNRLDTYERSYLSLRHSK